MRLSLAKKQEPPRLTTNQKHRVRKIHRHMKTSNYFCAFAIAGALTIARAQSIDTLSLPVGASSTLNAPSSGARQIAVVFQTGSLSCQVLDFTMKLASVSGTATSSFTITLWSVLGSTPDAVLGAVSGLNYSVSSPTDVTFSSADLTAAITGVTLDPNTRYAIAVNVGVLFPNPTVLTGANTRWMQTSGIPTTTDGWSYVDSVRRDGVGSWSSLSNQYLFAINTSTPSPSPTPVPEASGSIAGIGLAMAGLWQLRSRKTRQTVG